MNSTTLRFLSFSRVKFFLLLAALPAIASAADVAAWVVLNPNGPSPETIFSTDVAEKNNLVRGNWRVSGSGIIQTEAGADTGLLYRMIRPLPGGGVIRMLAVTPEEMKARLKAGFITEGALGYVPLKAVPGSSPVVRYTKGDRYLWLISKADQEWATKNGWTKEKTVFWLPADTYL
jgi:hypothetical protein